MVKLVERNPDLFVDCGNCGSRLSYKFNEPKMHFYGDRSWFSHITCVTCNNRVVVASYDPD